MESFSFSTPLPSFFSDSDPTPPTVLFLIESTNRRNTIDLIRLELRNIEELKKDMDMLIIVFL